MTLLQLCTWLSDTAFSHWLREAPYPYPVLLIVHILTIGLFGTLVILLNLRVLGWALPAVPITYLLKQSRPWKCSALALLTVSGLLVAASDPLEYYDNPMFWISLALLGLAGLNAWHFSARISPNISAWDGAESAPPARGWALRSLCLWILLIFAGRAIAFF
jgi:uncharacterized membrane protein